MIMEDHRLSTEVPLDLPQGAEKGLDHDGPHRPTTISVTLITTIDPSDAYFFSSSNVGPSRNRCCLGSFRILLIHLLSSLTASRYFVIRLCRTFASSISFIGAFTSFRSRLYVIAFSAYDCSSLKISLRLLIKRPIIFPRPSFSSSKASNGSSPAWKENE
jgi:hypothetical protein